MARISAEQVLAKLKQNGAFDTMRRELLNMFRESSSGHDFDHTVQDTLQWLTEDMDISRLGEKADSLERRVIGHFDKKGIFDQLERDARNHWLAKGKRGTLRNRILDAVTETANQHHTESPLQADDGISRPFDIDPPRLSAGAGGLGQAPRTHNYYRRGESVAAFVPTVDPLCQSSPQFACLMVEITACDAPKNIYSVRDPDANEGEQNSWAVYWDQILMFKRPQEYKYRVGDQVYALFRDDLGADSAVTTEFFPGRVECVGPMSLAVRFDTGALAHVYYDEVFAAGRVGFLRRKCNQRRRTDAHDAMVMIQGDLVPSYTGFWPQEAEPKLGKRNRKVKYRSLPPLLVDLGSSQRQTARHQQQAQKEGTPEHSARVSSDMDTDSSSSSPILQQPDATQDTVSSSQPNPGTFAQAVRSKYSSQPKEEGEEDEEGEIDIDTDQGAAAPDAAPKVAAPSRAGDQLPGDGGLSRHGSMLRSYNDRDSSRSIPRDSPRWRRGDEGRRRSRFDTRSPSRSYRAADRYRSPSRGSHYEPPMHGHRRRSYAPPHDYGGHRRSPSPRHYRRSRSRDRYHQRASPRGRDEHYERRRSRSRSRGPVPAPQYGQAPMPPAMPFEMQMLSPEQQYHYHQQQLQHQHQHQQSQPPYDHYAYNSRR